MEREHKFFGLIFVKNRYVLLLPCISSLALDSLSVEFWDIHHCNKIGTWTHCKHKVIYGFKAPIHWWSATELPGHFGKRCSFEADVLIALALDSCYGTSLLWCSCQSLALEWHMKMHCPKIYNGYLVYRKKFFILSPKGNVRVVFMVVVVMVWWQ